MNEIEAIYLKDEIVDSFGRDVIKARWSALDEKMNHFIKEMGLSNSVRVDRFLLSVVIADYFNDIQRLKAFHPIGEINSIKVISYTAYWLLRRKPLQVYSANSDKELITINEKFVLQYICTYLSVRKREKHIFLREDKGLKSFSSMLLYFLIYRVHDPYSLEMIIMAFFAGQIYEQTDEDISSEFHPYDVAWKPESKE